jgi:putative membrane-bound dehydrogenase-like protein
MLSRLSLLVLALALLSLHAAEPSVKPWGPARWVWDNPQAAEEDQGQRAIYLRRTFELPAKPKTATVHVTVDNRYELFVNGAKVGADDEWQSVEKYDVARHLVAGKNAVALRAQNDGGPAGALLWLHIATDDGKQLVLGTDDSWRVADKAGEGWQKADFDDAKWAKASVLGPAGMGPWNLEGASGGERPIGDRKITSYQSAEAEEKQFVLPEGFTVELVAAEPLVVNPVCIALDERGRLYVSESHTYRYGPKGSPVPNPTNPIVRLDPKPDGKGYERVVVTEGFDDPVMGMLVKDGKLWATANNFLYRFDLDDKGKVTNRQTLLTDRNKAWNPFGMFVLEWGPDGLLYMSVGNHNIDLVGPSNKATSRGSSGLVLRMKPDGRDMERLVHGLRVPYGYEYDPFGQLWVLSNGEGNPDRFVRVIEGVDYHCYSRPAVGNEWLAGRHPLAPPCLELPGGACTQLVRYYGAGLPEKMVGDLFLVNWGRHGFNGANRVLHRYVPDARGQIIHKDILVGCKDPHFRSSHVLLAPDGGLLVADWYGRDDESDQTGRIWKVSYTGKDKPKVEHDLTSPRWKETDYQLSALGSPHHLVRERAVEELARQGNAVTEKLQEVLRKNSSALGAAQALWTLWRIGTPEAQSALAAGAENGDGRVRRLAVHLLRRAGHAGALRVAERLKDDRDPAVRIEAALALKPEEAAGVLVAALEAGGASDPHLRYEAAHHLARCTDNATLGRLLKAEREELQLAGLIAIDVALYENLPARSAALTTLAGLLESPGKVNLDHLLTLARLHASKELMPGILKLAARDDVPPAVTAKAVLLLRSLGGKNAGLGEEAARRFLAAVRTGALKLSTPAEVLTLFDLLAVEGPSKFALEQIQPRLADKNTEIRDAAHVLARGFGPKANSLASSLWPIFDRLVPAQRMGEKIQALGTLAIIEEKPDLERWKRLLNGDREVVRDAIRSWRAFAERREFVDALIESTPDLVVREPGVKEDLGAVLVALKVDPARVRDARLPKGPPSPEERRKLALEARPQPINAALGRRVFERAGCVRCHTTVTENVPLAPSLKGIGKAQKPEYLIESILEPSKVIKTGYETEQIECADGRIYTGLVKDEGTHLRVYTDDKEFRIDKKKIDTRTVQKVSFMPAGLADGLSQDEFNDLIAYLRSLQ